MKLACFAMMRNEAGILEPFLDQLEEFFDIAVVLDHGSTDDSLTMVRNRATYKIEVFHLKSPGYPQSTVATFFARRIFSDYSPDFLFFLDCDEFLPFSGRSELESFLKDEGNVDVLRLRWLNLCPVSLDGGNIFSDGFYSASKLSPTVTKVVVGANLGTRVSDWTVHQGYHAVSVPDGESLQAYDVDDRWLYHIPIQSRTQFYLKLAAGSLRLRCEKINLLKHQGWHWVDLAQEAATHRLSDEELRTIALGYPDRMSGSAEPPLTLEFGFPYVKSPYAESLSGQIQGLMQQVWHDTPQVMGERFTVTDDAGQILFSSGPAAGNEESTTRRTPPEGLFANSLVENYSDLVEPLFNLPTRMPASAWVGHIPFLFVLFRVLRPHTYVELGVHTGASLIAACTAAMTYRIPTLLTGVDTWQGDQHAGFYEGDEIYRDLATYLSATFPKARLHRGLFAEALCRFSPGSIDVLHIDGLHTYDAVKEDFTSWFGQLSTTGVILFHDIAVYDRGFGVHRLWSELKEHFVTLEFQHSFGLGVVLLAPGDERLRPLVALARDPKAWSFYQDLVASVSNTIAERMAAFHSNGELEATRRQLEETKRELELAQHQNAALYASTSWRVTRPLRALRQLGR